MGESPLTGREAARELLGLFVALMRKVVDDDALADLDKLDALARSANALVNLMDCC